MKRRSRNILMAIMCAAVLGLAILSAGLLTCRTVRAAENGTEGAGGTGSEFSIEVVEELSIDDQVMINDEQVPLASFDRGPTPAGNRHAIMMGVVFLTALGYAVYVERHEKKLHALRMEAARAQKEAMRAERRRRDTAGG